MGFFDKFFAGYNSEDTAVTPFVQPSTRPELFRLAFKENFWRLVPLNLLYLAFCIPLIAWCILNIMQLQVIFSGDAESLRQSLLGMLYVIALGLIPCILVTGPASAGIAYVTRNIARDQPSMIWQDFLHGLKNNWKQALLPSGITSTIPLVAYCYIAFLSTNPDQKSVSVLPAVICMIAIVLWVIAAPTIYMMMVTYHLKFKALVKNALIMTITHLPTAIGIGLLRLIPAMVIAIMVLFFSAPLGFVLLVVYGVLWGVSLDWLLCSSFANYLCEHYINPQIGEPTRIGLRNSKAD